MAEIDLARRQLESDEAYEQRLLDAFVLGTDWQARFRQLRDEAAAGADKQKLHQAVGAAAFESLKVEMLVERARFAIDMASAW
jgi:hypothetical protein